MPLQNEEQGTDWASGHPFVECFFSKWQMLYVIQSVQLAITKYYRQVAYKQEKVVKAGSSEEMMLTSCYVLTWWEQGEIPLGSLLQSMSRGTDLFYEGSTRMT